MLGLLSVEGLRSAVEIESAYVALVAAQVFFLVLLWPRFERRAVTGPPLESLAGAAARLAGLVLLSVPLIFVALRTSEAGPATVLRSQALIVFIGIIAGAAVRLPGAAVWYYPAAFLVSAVVPLVAYLLLEEGGLSTRWAESISPFWAAGAAAAGARRVAPLIVFAGVAVAALGVALWAGLRGARAAHPDQA